MDGCEGGGSGKKWSKFRQVDGYTGEREGIHRNWMSRAIISISIIRVQKCSRQMSGSALDSEFNLN